jgi:hypothetical protein
MTAHEVPMPLPAAARLTPPATRPARVIGGAFGLATAGDATTAPAWLVRPDQLAFANARGALRAVQRWKRPARVWMPAFLCDSMSRQVAAENQELRWYPLDETLAATDLAWLDDVAPGDVVLVVDYFGFVLHAALARAARARGAFVVEDAAHALLTDRAGSLGDVAIFSPRKCAGLPDGGLLRGAALPPVAALPTADGRWFTLAVDAATQRGQFDRGERDDRGWLALNQEAERLHPDEPTAMSALSHRLAATIDWAAIAARRRDNYRALAERLAPLALFPDLPDGTVPHGFTIRVRDRDAVRAALFAHDIFPSLLWPLAGVVPASFTASHRLSADVMTLHCDQRYDPDDMHRIARLVLDAGGGA